MFFFFFSPTESCLYHMSPAAWGGHYFDCNNLDQLIHLELKTSEYSFGTVSLSRGYVFFCSISYSPSNARVLGPTLWLTVLSWIQAEMSTRKWALFGVLWWCMATWICLKTPDRSTSSFTNAREWYAKDLKAIQAVWYLHNIPNHIRRQNLSTNHCIIE